MFDLFKKSNYSELTKPIPYVTSPEPETKKHETIYAVGVTEEGSYMTLKVGYSTLTMSKLGCEQLIEQLEVFKNQLKDLK